MTTTTGRTYTAGKVRVLTPNPKKLNPSVLRKPFILVARLPREAHFLSVHSLPNILEVMGMGSGGGAPGISVMVPNLSKQEPKHPKTNRFIAAFMPGADVICNSHLHCLGLHIGTSASAGMVLNYFEVLLLDETKKTASFDEIHTALDEAGYEAIDLVDYETPPALLARAGTTGPVVP